MRRRCSGSTLVPTPCLRRGGTTSRPGSKRGSEEEGGRSKKKTREKRGRENRFCALPILFLKQQHQNFYIAEEEERKTGSVRFVLSWRSGGRRREVCRRKKTKKKGRRHFFHTCLSFPSFPIISLSPFETMNALALRSPGLAALRCVSSNLQARFCIERRLEA